jgi:hypothetical protein
MNHTKDLLDQECIERSANPWQEADGLDIPSLFDSAREVLEELDSMKEDSETASDAITIKPELIPEINQLSQIARAELNCKCCHFFLFAPPLLYWDVVTFLWFFHPLSSFFCNTIVYVV